MSEVPLKCCGIGDLGVGIKVESLGWGVEDKGLGSWLRDWRLEIRGWR